MDAEPIKLGDNIPDAPDNVYDRYLFDNNQFLELAPPISGQAVPSGWTSIDDFTFIPNDPEVWDHMHYLVSTNFPSWSRSDFNNAPYFDNDVADILIPLPEGISYVSFIQHNVNHQWRGETTDIAIFGPFRVDLSPPSGVVQIADGYLYIESTNTHIRMWGEDHLSGISGVYIDGHIADGPGIREWIPYESFHVIAISGEAGPRYVSVRFMDNVGNISQVVVDDVLLKTTKYLFKRLQVKTPSFQGGEVGEFENNERRMGENMPPKMTAKEHGDEHGEF